MRQFLQWLMTLWHGHRWETIAETDLVRPEQTVHGVHYGERNGRRYIQRCTVCGLVVKRDLI
jgi:hypothetical protein